MTMRKAIAGQTSIAARAALLSVAVLTLSPAQAHHVSDLAAPTTIVAGLLSGLGHPVIGLGSLLFLLAIGLWCAASGPKHLRRPPGGTQGDALRRYTLPMLLFGSIAGGMLQASGMGLPADDLLVALSVCGAGLLLLLATPERLSGGALRGAMLGLCAGALAHGMIAAEGSAGASGSPLLAYWIGILSMQSALWLGAYYAAGILAVRRPRAAARAHIAAGILLLIAGGTLLIAPGLGQVI